MSRFVPCSLNASMLELESEFELDGIRSSEQLDEDELFNEEEWSSSPLGDRCALFLDLLLESLRRCLDFLFFFLCFLCCE
jgi:hypothetical protein